MSTGCDTDVCWPRTAYLKNDEQRRAQREGRHPHPVLPEPHHWGLRVTTNGVAAPRRCSNCGVTRSADIALARLLSPETGPAEPPTPPHTGSAPTTSKEGTHA